EDDSIDIINGLTTWRIARRGTGLIELISIAGKPIATDGKLVCILEDRSDYETGHTIREQQFDSAIESVDIEQPGPLRAVIRIRGRHKSETDAIPRTWLPFTVRLYFFAGVDPVRMVHSIVFDGDQEKDFVRGLGLRFSVPMREEEQNRHVRFAGQD